MSDHGSPSVPTTQGERPMRPFSNGSEFDYWTARNCSKGRGCIHDSAFGTAPEDTFCPLITKAYDGEWPEEWPVERVIYAGDCTEFVEATP